MKVLIICVVIYFTLPGLTEAQCQAQSTTALKSMLMSAGGTLNSQMVSTNWEGTQKFKNHFAKAGRKVVMTQHEVEQSLDKLEQKLITNLNKRYRRAIGTTVIRGCSVPQVLTAENLFRPCHTCDATTTLPSNYFPRFINQVICDPNKAAVCFQGEGECKARSLSITFLRKTGNCVTGTGGILLEEWTPEVISVGTCCECMIKATSFFQFLL